MNSTPYPKSTEPDGVLIARADEQLPHVTKSTPNLKATEPNDLLFQRADESPAYATEPPSQLERDAARHPSAVPGRRSSRGRPALRGLIGLLLATCILLIGVFVSQSAYRDAARLIIAQWTSSLPLKRPGLPVQPSPSAALQEAAPTAAPLSPELAQMLQTMARDLANVQQGIEQLKTSQEQTASDNAKALKQLKTNQEQTASDNAKTLEQLKTSQEQMASDNAKTAEQIKAVREQMVGFPAARASAQNLQARTPAPKPHPIAAPKR
jgi:hypothetical protein